ncbi:MAG: lytic transglycosylase domain-containing protein [Bryobacteraceae bacterium]|jgi:membrane-bound lytic murein transglycosylase D|nr:lytic transglycosylase domain-containing protein [Bryobacteraceae bacterium]
MQSIPSVTMLRPLLGLFLLGSIPDSAFAEEGVPHWARVLDEILVRAEAEKTGRGTAEATEVRTSLLLEQPQTGIHLPHPAVGKFIEYFTGAVGARHWLASRSRLETYRTMIEQVFDQEGLPRKLLWVGLVESGFNPLARSPKNAVGIWQFIPETAEAFGLRIEGPDERSDPAKSTRAAARYLKLLYARFGDWPLALAAYNAGERTVQEAARKGQTTDFWRLADAGLLPRETQAYVPAVLAAQYLGEGRLGELEIRTRDDSTHRRGKVVFAAAGVSP